MQWAKRRLNKNTKELSEHMKGKVGDFLVKRLSGWGVRRVYGYPGDGINGIVGAFARAGDLIDFVQVRHEEMAAFRACAHAKFTGEVGVCLATSGPGAIHLLNGHYDAQLDHQPVVAIVGQQARSALGGNYQQEVDLMSLYKDVAREYVQMVSHPVQVRHLIDRAIRIAKVNEPSPASFSPMMCRTLRQSRCLLGLMGRSTLESAFRYLGRCPPTSTSRERRRF